MSDFTQTRPTILQLEEYYAALPKEYGYASQCRMELLGEIRGKRVLDVDCRRGKGAVKLADRVGQRGYVLGVDPNPEFIAISLKYLDDAQHGNGFGKSNMNYLMAYPEMLIDCGVPEGVFDLVFCNSSIALDYDPQLAFLEMGRALRPGGTLIYDGVLAEDPRDKNVVAQARKMGNAIQAAFSQQDLVAFTKAAGFDAPELYNISVVEPNVGFNDRFEVPTVETDERMTFIKVTARMYKPRW